MQYDLTLKGFVGDSLFNADETDRVLKEKAGKPVRVLIDSLGGILREGLSIADAFREHGDVSIHLRGMNASAATVATLGAKHISMSDSALYLVHKCSVEVMDWNLYNADELRARADELLTIAREHDKIDGMIAALYAGRCKKQPSELLELMSQDIWLTAQEALDWGFIDEIITTAEEKAPRLTETTATAMTAAGMPLPKMEITADGLRERIAQLFAKMFNNKNQEPMNEPKNQAPEVRADETQELETRVAELETKVADLETKQADLEAKQTDLESRIAALEEAAKEKPAKEEPAPEPEPEPENHHVVTTANVENKEEDNSFSAAIAHFAAARKMLGK